MNRIAEAECATCHIIRPKTEMREARVQRYSGSSFGIWSGSRSNQLGGSYREQYSHRDVWVWVCRTCKAPKSDWNPIQDLLAGFLVLFGLIALFLFISRGQPHSIPEDGNYQASEPDISMKGELSDGTAKQVTNSPSVQSEQVDEAALASMWRPRDENTVQRTEPDRPPAAIIDSGKWRRRIERALQTGSPQRWSQDGQRGYFVPSDASTTLTSICRNLSISTDDGEMAPFGTYCQSGGKEWVRR